jgi:hypothetical protein
MALRLSIFQLALVALLFIQCASFNIVQYRTPVHVTSTINSPVSHLFGSRRPKCSSPSLFMTEEPKEPEETETKQEKTISEKDSNSGHEKKRGAVTTALLAVPLVIKFVLVLFIKFLSDAVVFPVLFLSRFAKRIKRKILKFFGKDQINGGNPANGASE